MLTEHKRLRFLFTAAILAVGCDNRTTSLAPSVPAASDAASSNAAHLDPAEDGSADLQDKQSQTEIAEPVPKLGGLHHGGSYAAFADGGVRWISDTISPETLRKLCTKAGKEPIGDWP